MRELHRVIIYTTRMNKHMTNRVMLGAVHSVPCELRCQADTPPEVSMLDGNLTYQIRENTKRVLGMRSCAANATDYQVLDKESS